MDRKKSDHIFITKIRATDVTYGSRQLVTNFYVAVECDGMITKTSIKTIPFGCGVVDWDEQIPLPTDLSSSVAFKVYASFQQMALKLGNGKLVRQCEISIGELLDRNERLEAIKFPASKDKNALSFSSLRITTERRNCDSNDECLPYHRHKSNTKRELEELTHEGHHALLRYHQYKSQVDLDKAIACFGFARHRCPNDHPIRSAGQFSLANAMFVDCWANNYNLSLDVPIKLYRDTLRIRARSHPDFAQTTLQLCLALLVRFERRGDGTDEREVKDLLAGLMNPSLADSDIDNGGRRIPQMTKDSVSLQVEDSRASHTEDVDSADQIHMAQRMLRTLSHGDPRRPVILNALGDLLCRRFEEKGNMADINEAISMLEQAVQLVPNSHSNKPEFLSHLGILLQIRFERLGKITDVERSILMLEEALRLLPNGHPVTLSLLNNLGNAFLRRFQHLGNVADITKSVSTFEEIIRLTPDDHGDKLGVLNNLGSALLCRFGRLGDVTDIAKSVSMQEKALRLTPDGHPGKPGRLNNLGNVLLRRFELLGDVVDITKSVLMFEEAVRFTPDGHPDKVSCLYNLGNALLRRFERLGDVTDITKSVSFQEEAVRLTPDGHPDKPAGLSDLGNALSCRFERLGDVADITKSVLMQEEAVRLAPNGHPDKLRWNNNLGKALCRRFEQLGDVADITKSVSMFEEAVRLTPDSHPDKPSLLNNLGRALSNRFEWLGDAIDITKSVSMSKEAVRLTPDGHPDKPGWLHNLGNNLLRRFQRLGDIADITKSISMFEEAASLTPDSHPNKPCRLNDLGNALLRRFERLDDVVDIAKSVWMSEKAVRLAPDGHPDKPGYLNDLGNALVRRFGRLGDVVDITKSVSMFEEAVRRTPDTHPHKPSRLNNLGNVLLCRFERLGDIADITKSISTQEESVRLTPDGHVDKPTFLNNLATALCRRFERLNDINDIMKSVSMQEVVVRFTPDGHPDKPGQLNNLGNSFMRLFGSFHHPSDLVSATSHFSAAAQCSTGPTTIRFAAARKWISSAQVDGNSETLIDAYATALTLLPQLAWMGLPLAERHRVLVDAAHVATGAAAAALDAGLPDMAVEWLEQGRSIVWTQFLQLRTPVDLLRVTHPALADDFEQTSKQLERASTRDHMASAEVLVPDSWSQEKVVQEHHTLTLRREKLVADIRSLPGFDRFLLPKTIGQLATLASSGPVVYLNASQRRCDALIIVPGRGNVVHVPLCTVSYRHVERMHQLLVERDRLTAPIDDISLLTPSGERSTVDREGGPVGVEDIPCDRFQLVLQFLWSNVVHPVLDALAFLTPPSQGKKIPRILWCPMGPFSFLPIHAAGIYGPSPAGPKLSDFAISSYIPTLSALAPSTGKAPRSRPSHICLLTVPQPPTDGQPHLWGVNSEISTIKALSGESQFVTTEDSDGTVEDVTQKMDCADWVHFACHGIQDPVHPLDSGLCLANGRRLRLSDIIKLSRWPGGLAFLSACQTAKGEETLSEESVHLAAGMLLAGYDGVIATMWSIMDNDAPKVTRDVYKHLFKDGKIPDTREAAEALHRAVVRLRDEDEVPFSSWVPFIHVGR